MSIFAILYANCIAITQSKYSVLATAYGSVEQLKQFTDPKAKSSYAFCSIYSGDDEENKEYYKGIITLGYTLKRMHPHIDRVLIISPDVRDKVFYFQKVWTHIYYRPFMVFPSRLSYIINEANYIYKIYLWTLSQYSKVIFMASDILPVSNLLPIFDENAPAAPIDSTLYRIGTKNALFNTDFMLVKPSMVEFMSITHFIFSKYKIGDKRKYHHITNDILNQYFGDKINIMKLSTLFDNSQCVNTALGDASNLTIRSNVIHFGQQEKPWIPKTKGFAKLWRSFAACAGQFVGLNICNESTEIAERVFLSLDKKNRIAHQNLEDEETKAQKNIEEVKNHIIIRSKDLLSLTFLLLFGMMLLYKVLSIHHNEDPGFTIFSSI